jgi:crossover junction endodeoxyribonuclease RuvC
MKKTLSPVYTGESPLTGRPDMKKVILGIDPGLENTGWAVVEDTKLIEYGVVKVGKGDIRLRDLYDGLTEIIRKHKVGELAFEKLFFAKNAKSALSVAEAIGVVKVCALKNDVQVYSYTPLEVKMAMVGFGRAEKEQVEEMVRQTLGIEEIIKPSHAADAVAVALTHGFTMRL